MSSKQDSRYPASLRSSYDRPHLLERRPSPSPGPSVGYPFYDHRFSPPRPGPSHREEYANGYRPDSWRSERTYYARTPSPDRYSPARTGPVETSNRNSWRATQTPWQHSRSPQYPPYDRISDRPRRETMAQRMFEPSDSWKQSHSANTEHHDGDRTINRPAEPIARSMRDPSPERTPARDGFPTYGVPSPRYSPPRQNNRDIPPYMGPRSDSYRPAYDDRGPWEASYSPDAYASDYDKAPREKPSMSYSTRQSIPRQDISDRRYHSRERSVSSVGSPQRSCMTSPPAYRTTFLDRTRTVSNPERYRNSSPAKGSYSAPLRPMAPPRSGFKSRSSSRSSEVSRAPRLNIVIPTESDAALADERDSLASTPRVSPRQTPVLKPVEPPPAQSSFTLRDRFRVMVRQNVPKPLQVPKREVTEFETSEFLSGPPPPPPARSSPRGSKPTTMDIDITPLSKQGNDQPMNDSIEKPAKDQKVSSPTSTRHVEFASSGVSPKPTLSTDDQAATVPTLRDDATDVTMSEARDAEKGPVAPEARTTSSGVLSNIGNRIQRSSSVRDIIPIPVEVPRRHEVEAAPEQPYGGEMKSLQDALHMIVMTRLRCDRQRREERVEPVLLANLAIAGPPVPARPEDEIPVIKEFTQGEHLQALEGSFETARPSLQIRFAQRQADLTGKVQRLKEEYLTLHDRWLVHCAKLDDVAKAGALEEAAATAGRTTRRSIATLGDAVRSDLEMEQIIASLGNEELTDANHLSARNAATIPNMTSVTQGDIEYLYDDSNNIIDDPSAFYAPHTGMNDWTEEEKAIFIGKYAEYPKQFGIIADFLPNKTAAQCVTYYYLHKKKHIDFRKVVSRYTYGKRRRGGRKGKGRGNALLSDILQRDAEVSREHTPVTSAGRKTKPVVVAPVEKRPAVVRRNNSNLEHTPGSTPTPDPEPEPRRKRRRVTATRVAMTAEPEANDDGVDAEPKPVRRGRKPKKPKVAEDTTATNSPSMTVDDVPHAGTETKFIDQTELGARKKGQQGNVSWSEDDKAQFLMLLAQYGDDFKRIAASMPNKTTIQVSAFYKANVEEMDLENVAASAPKRSPTPEPPRDTWNESSYAPGLVTSNATSTPPEGVQLNLAGASMETRFRVKATTHPSPNAPGVPIAQPVASLSIFNHAGIAAANTFQFRATTVEAMQAQYSGRQQTMSRSQQIVLPEALPPFKPGTSLGPSHEQHTSAAMLISTSPIPSGHIANPSPFTSASSAPLTTTFPSSFPYNNLSPSHFCAPAGSISQSGMREQSAPELHTSIPQSHSPQPPPPPPDDFDTFVHPPQSWSRAPLQTTDDLAAYLEHRTRLSEQRS